MQTAKHCEQYLNSSEVIRILQSNNETFTARVLECIRASREEICSGTITSHYLISTELLNLCREDAFLNTQLIFVKKVRNNNFTPDRETCIPYLKTVFRRLYGHEYRKELQRKMKIQNMIPADEIGEKETYHDLKENVKKILSQLNEHDREMYRLRYEEGMKVKEMAGLLGIAPESVTKKLSRLHDRFRSLWLNYQ